MHTLPQLPYQYNALEPHIDAKTMEIHHSKHHQGYVDKLNAALEKYPDLKDTPVEKLLSDFKNLPDEIKTAVQNHGGGHANHSLFWTILSPTPQKMPAGKLAQAIDEQLAGLTDFKEKFSAGAASHFGSGWMWLVMNEAGRLLIYSTKNQDSPLMSGHTPLIGLDVWEHAYYLKHQNKRADYIQAFWEVLDWKAVEKQYGELVK